MSAAPDPARSPAGLCPACAHVKRIESALAPRLPLVARASEVWLMTERRKRWTKKARFQLGR